MPQDRGVAEQGQISEEGTINPQPAGEVNGKKKKKKSRFYRRFAQQELKGWSPIITGNVVVIYFFLVTLLCIALGIPILKASTDVVQFKVRYDDTGAMAGKTSAQQQGLLQAQQGNGLTTSVNMTVTKDMQPPVSSAVEPNAHSAHYPRCRQLHLGYRITGGKYLACMSHLQPAGRACSGKACALRLLYTWLPLALAIDGVMRAAQVYLYYELDRYYQNHKRYVRSRDDNQLAGVTEPQLRTFTSWHGST